MKAIINNGSSHTIGEIRELNMCCETARREAKELMRKGDLNRYFMKLLQIARIEDELLHDLAA